MANSVAPVGPLVSADWLMAHLGEPQLAVVDCRWRLGQPGDGRRAYEAGHVPGAAFLDLDEDLSAPPGDGRHPLPDPPAFAAACARAGIAADSQVVAYDGAGEGGAVRLWWLLRHFGHPAAAVMDGGMGAWRAAGGALEPGGPEPAGPGTSARQPAPFTPFVPHPRSDDVAGAEEIAARGAELDLVDARSPERFRGEVEPVDPVAGHIPGAGNVPFTELAPAGRYLPPDRLRELLAADPDRELVAYCGSGVTSASVILAAELAGLQPARLYPGSWSQWCARGLPADSVPTARDDEERD